MLSAIYNLEFYKKKNDWKLSKEPSPKKTDKLDKIHDEGEQYSNPKFDAEQVSDNKVSLHEESDAAGHEGYSLKEEFTSWCDEDQGQKLEIQVFDAPDPPMTAAMSSSIEVPTNDMSELLDDTADFMRGAHLALHSSEVDLNTTTEECSCIGLDNLWALSEKKLARAIQRHELALARLLEEAARRD